MFLVPRLEFVDRECDLFPFPSVFSVVVLPFESATQPDCYLPSPADFSRRFSVFLIRFSTSAKSGLPTRFVN